MCSHLSNKTVQVGISWSADKKMRVLYYCSISEGCKLYLVDPPKPSKFEGSVSSYGEATWERQSSLPALATL